MTGYAGSAIWALDHALSVMGVGMVMVMVNRVMAMMMIHGKDRSGKDHQQQYGDKNLLHETNLT